MEAANRGDPAAAFTEEELLVTQAIAYGVTPSVAHALLVAHRTRLAEVLAAVTVGLLRPERSLPDLANTVTRSGKAIEDFGRRVTDSDYALGLVFDRPGQQYLAWCEEELGRRLAERRDVDVDALRAEVEVARRRGRRPGFWRVYTARSTTASRHQPDRVGALRKIIYAAGNMVTPEVLERGGLRATSRLSTRPRL